MKISCGCNLFATLALAVTSWSTTNTGTDVWAFVVSPSPTAITSRTSASTSASTSTTTSLNAAALIVQNKGGGHGELGYQLAKVLLSDYSETIDKITILQDDDADFENSEPFRSYAHELAPRGVTINSIKMTGDDLDYIDATFIQNMLGGRDEKYEYVFDNCSKKPEGVAKAIVDCVASWDGGRYCKLYVYVSSAGMYVPDKETKFPMSEDSTPIKESSGQHLFDTYVASEKQLPLVSFRPQYIYGKKSNKHTYIDYYLDCLLNNDIHDELISIPIPGDGSQLVSLTNSEDVATLLASPLLDAEAAIAQRYFNCGTDQLLSYKDVGYFCADAANIPRNEIEFVTSSDDEDKPKGFPFRPTNFYVAPDMAKDKLQWPGAKNTLQQDLKEWYYEGYQTRNHKE